MYSYVCGGLKVIQFIKKTTIKLYSNILIHTSNEVYR